MGVADDPLRMLLKPALRRTPLYPLVTSVRYRLWVKQGRPIPPPHLVKVRVVRQYARAFSLRTMIESGTYLGDMVAETRNLFDRIITIELDPQLATRARRLFRSQHNVSVVAGDSGEVLPLVLAEIDSPCLFWLDGHYSGAPTARGSLQTPIIQELRTILDHAADHVILIDDARAFDGTQDYPTIDKVRSWVESGRPGWVVDVADDIVRIHTPAVALGRA